MRPWWRITGGWPTVMCRSLALSWMTVASSLSIRTSLRPRDLLVSERITRPCRSGRLDSRRERRKPIRRTAVTGMIRHAIGTGDCPYSHYPIFAADQFDARKNSRTIAESSIELGTSAAIVRPPMHRRSQPRCQIRASELVQPRPMLALSGVTACRLRIVAASRLVAASRTARPLTRSSHDGRCSSTSSRVVMPLSAF